jgi:hypothetical protein
VENNAASCTNRHCKKKSWFDKAKVDMLLQGSGCAVVDPHDWVVLRSMQNEGLCVLQIEGLIMWSAERWSDYVFCRMREWLCVLQNDGLIMCSAEWGSDYVFCKMMDWLCVLQNEGLIMRSAEWSLENVFCRMMDRLCVLQNEGLIMCTANSSKE